ncbi:MAG: hypothetical protein HYS23_09555 [Geobacter sp.]|nr:hypothetical protein [Geobacter sp.]
MRIIVQYRDNTFKHVQNQLLDDLIDAGEIMAFRRSSGWVEIGRDQLRSKRAQPNYAGLERRALPEQASCLTCPELEDSVCKAECGNRIAPWGMVPAPPETD